MGGYWSSTNDGFRVVNRNYPMTIQCLIVYVLPPEVRTLHRSHPCVACIRGVSKLRVSLLPLCKLGMEYGVRLG